MIEVTRINETKLMINNDLIEIVEENPNTVITLVGGKKVIVKESKYEIRDKIILHKQKIFAQYGSKPESLS